MVVMDAEILQLVERAAKILRESAYTVVFSGAGISTASGIPDFRTEGEGLWEKVDPYSVASLTAFQKTPKHFFDWIKSLYQISNNVEPNSAHYAIASMESAGMVQAVITQNIDGLHHKAGSQRVFELHGTVKTATCPLCMKIHDTEELLENYSKEGILPTCENCSVVIKPDVILFEEMLPQDTWMAAEMEIVKADVVLATGSSLEVYPANSLPRQGVWKGAKLLINTLSTTPLDSIAEIVINADVTEVLPELFRLMKN